MPDVAEMVDFAVGQRRAAIGTSVSDLGEDPDKAARAIGLSRSTGVPPILIHRNLEEFEQQHKAGIVNNILSNNEYLRNWVASDSMASKVANDDWGQLDKVSQRLAPLKWNVSMPRILHEGLKGFGEGFGLATGEAFPKI